MKMYKIAIFALCLLVSLKAFAVQETFNFGNVSVGLIQGDITKLPKNLGIEIIVNAANKELSRGGGVCGAIFQAAEGSGTELQDFISDRFSQGIATGKAVVTPGFNLKSQGIKYIIHAVGPDYREYQNKRQEEKQKAAQLLYDAYENSLKLATQHDIKRIAFPFISSAIYAYPKLAAAGIAIDAVRDYAKNHSGLKVYFVLFSKEDYDIFHNALRAERFIERNPDAFCWVEQSKDKCQK